MLTRGLPRHSTDLDFDSGKKINIRTRIELGLATAGMELQLLTVPKDTNTVQRFKVHYQDILTGIRSILKVETSFRAQPSVDLVETVNGIRTYKIEHMIEQKIAAMQNRTQARDLYDLEYLATEYGFHCTPKQIQKISTLIADLDGLAERYDVPFANDPILAGHAQVEGVILKLQEAIDGLQERLTKNGKKNTKPNPEPSSSPSPF